MRKVWNSCTPWFDSNRISDIAVQVRESWQPEHMLNVECSNQTLEAILSLGMPREKNVTSSNLSWDARCNSEVFYAAVKGPFRGEVKGLATNQPEMTMKSSSQLSRAFRTALHIRLRGTKNKHRGVWLSPRFDSFCSKLPISLIFSAPESWHKLAWVVSGSVRTTGHFHFSRRSSPLSGWTWFYRVICRWWYGRKCTGNKASRCRLTKNNSAFN